MVWACVWLDERGRLRRSKLVIIECDSDAKKRGYSAKSYMEALTKGLLPHYRRTKLCSDLDDAINSFIDPFAGGDQDEDEYERWKRCEPIVGQDLLANKHPIKYWLGFRDQYPNLTKLAIDVLSIPASSCECERVFSELGDLLKPRRRNIGPELLAAIQCVRRWLRAKFGDDEVANKATITDQELELVYRLSAWDDSLLNTI
jgi:hypothetical protein